MEKQRRDPYFYQYRNTGGEAKWNAAAGGPSQEREEVQARFDFFSFIDSPRKLISVVAVVVFGVGVGLYTLLTPENPSTPDIPLIRSTEGPIKIRPDKPGGIHIPHQDKLIYDRLTQPQPIEGSADATLVGVPETPYQAAEEVRNDMLPPVPSGVPEAVQGAAIQYQPQVPDGYQAGVQSGVVAAPSPPIPAAPVEAGVAPQGIAVPDNMQQTQVPQTVDYEAWPKATPPHLAARKLQEKKAQVVPSPTPQIPPHIAAIPAEAPRNVAPAMEEAGLAQLEVQAPVPGPEVAVGSAAPSTDVQQPFTPPVDGGVKTKKAAKVAKAAKSTPKGGVIGPHAYKLQVGSLASQTQAEQEIKRLWKKFPVLSSYRSKIIRVDLGGRGIRFRILAGPISNEKQARAVCQTLNQQKVGCIMMKPGA